MIKKLRRRFTAVLTVSLSLVMLAVTASIYIFMYRSEAENAERIIEFATQAEPMPAHEIDGQPKMPHEPDKEYHPEIHFEKFPMPHKNDGIYSGWISVYLKSNNEIEDVFYSQRRFFDDDAQSEKLSAAVAMAAEKIIAKGSSDGLITADDISYRYRLTESGGRRVIVLLDRTAEISTMNRLLAILAGIFILSIAVIFVLSMQLAKWAAHPVEDAWNRQKVFFSNASHELKTPLTVISANLEVITSNPDDTVSGQKKWFDHIRSEADKMSRLINEMLYISREENTQLPAVMTEFDLSETAEGACLAMDAVAFEKGRVLSSEIESGIIMRGEKESVARMINILIDNALSHSEENSEIMIKLARVKGKIIFSAANKGKPISAEDIERIFDRYYRTDASRSSDTGGFGLGLAIAKTIAEKHGGSISARSDQTETTFTVILPDKRG